MGAFSVRVRDIYFGIITLVFGVLAFIIANTWISVTKGEDGITIQLPKFAVPGLGAIDARDLVSFWYLTFAVVVVSYLLLYRLMHSPVGLVFRGIRENEQRARYVGYNVNAYKILNTAISGFFASLAGVLLLLKNGIIGTEQMDVLHSGEVVIWSVIGGVGTLIGPFLGAALVFALTDYLGQFTQRYVLIVGLVFIVTILLAPKGILGALIEAWQPAATTNKEEDQ
jgi:branched-chain amino acid transport system permease protein